MLEVHAKDLDDLWDKVNHEFIYGFDLEDFSRPGVSRHSFDNVLRTDNCEIKKITLTALGYSTAKWRMLLKLYFDSYEYGLMLNRLRHYREKEQRGKKYVVDIGMQFKTRENRTGACLSAIYFRYSVKNGWECTVFSRTNETTARWSVDLIFINRLVEAVGRELGGIEKGYFDPSTIRLTWYAASLFQSVVTCPMYLIIMGREKECKILAKRYLKAYPNAPHTDWQLQVGRRYGQSYNGKFSIEGKLKYQTYKSQARITEAYEIGKGIRPPKYAEIPNESLKIPDADFSIKDDFFTKKGFR